MIKQGMIKKHSEMRAILMDILCISDPNCKAGSFIVEIGRMPLPAPQKELSVPTTRDIKSVANTVIAIRNVGIFDQLPILLRPRVITNNSVEITKVPMIKVMNPCIHINKC